MKKNQKGNAKQLVVFALAIVLAYVGLLVTVKGVNNTNEKDISLGDTVALCPAGKYEKTTIIFHSCHDCPKGYFCPGNNMRYLCPIGTTKNAGAKKPSECIRVSKVCPAGKYLDNNNECITCPRGSYCYGNKKYSCPSGTTTESTGAISVSNCSNANIVKEFVDSGAGNKCVINGEIIGVNNGLAYVNVSLEDVTTYSDEKLTGVGKIGIVVSDDISINKDIILGTPFGTDKFVLDKTSQILRRNQKAKFSLTVEDSAGLIVFSSSNAKVIKINSIDASNCGGTISTPKDPVLPIPSSDSVPVTGIALSNSSMSLMVGQTEKIGVTIKPSNATNRTILWVSSDPSVVKVSSSGAITGVKAGMTTIIARTMNGKIAVCKVVVSEKQGTCPSGSYISSVDQTTGKVACSPCARGYYCINGNMIVCPNGTTTAGIGAKNINECTVGSVTPPPPTIAPTLKPGTYSFCCVKNDGETYLWRTNQTSKACPTNYILDENRTIETCRKMVSACYGDRNGNYYWTSKPDADWILIGNVKKAEDCLPNKIIPTTATPTIICAAGKYRGPDNKCAICPVGFYCSDNLMKKCPSGKTTKTTGAKNVSECSAVITPQPTVAPTTCIVGQYLVSGKCVVCPKGSYCVNGKRIACPSGTTTAGSGAKKVSECSVSLVTPKPTSTPKATATPKPPETTCVPGQYLVSGRCVVCPNGSYCVNGKRIACPSGKTTKTSGARSVSDCSVTVATPKPTSTPKVTCTVGKYFNGTSCVVCPKGSYCYGYDKYACPKGTTTSSTGATSVALCTNANYIRKFIDSGIGKSCIVTYTVSGVGAGKAYINVSVEDAVSYNANEPLTGFGKVGVLVKSSSADTGTVPSGEQINVSDFILNKKGFGILKGKKTTFAIRVNNAGGVITVSSSNAKIVKVTSVDTSKCS